MSTPSQIERAQRRKIQLLGVPLDHGAGRRGVGMGPAALRIAGLHGALEALGYEVEDRGDIEIPAPETLSSGKVNAKFLPLIANTCRRVAQEVGAMLEENAFPLILGGDHSLAVGTISGLSHHLRAQRPDVTPPKLGVLWFDAHADINTPATSPSGNVHGMPVSCLLALGPTELAEIGYPGPKFPPAMFSQIGLREIDETEKRLLRDSGVHCYTMTHIDKRSMREVMEEALACTTDAEMLHLSLDIDAVDPRVAPGTGTPKLGGLTYREAHLAMEMIADTGRLTSLEVVEVNPTLDDQNRTAELAVSLVASALGMRIL